MSRRVLRNAAVLTVCAVAFALTPAYAEVQPVSSEQGDKRITAVAFNEDEIVRVRVGKHGVQIVFSQDEALFEVDLGDPTKTDYREISSGWLWDRSQNTLYFRPWPGMAVEQRIVRIVSPLPGGGNRRYQLELVPTTDAAPNVPSWQRPLEGMEVRAALDGSAVASDMLPPGPLPAPTPARAEPAPAVVRFTYAKQEATAQAEAARRKREDAIREWRAIHPTPPVRASQAEQKRLRGEVEASAQAATMRKRCNVMWRGDRRFVPRAVCTSGLYTTFAYTGMTVPAIFGVGPDGKDVKVQQGPIPGQPGLIMAWGTSEFWRVRYADVVVAEFYDASYDPMGGVVTGTDTASPSVRMTIPERAIHANPSGGPVS